MTVKTRITLFVAAAGLIASLLFSLVVFLELIEQPFNILDTVLQEEAYSTTSMLVQHSGEHLAYAPHVLDAHPLYPYWIAIYRQDNGRLLYRSYLAGEVKLPSVPPGSARIARVLIPLSLINLGQDENERVSFRIKTFLFHMRGQAYLVQIARPMEKLEDEISDLVLGIIAGLLFSTLALAAISQFVAGKILKPIAAMKDLTQDIGEKNLDRRLPTGDEPDEFSDLARTINQMLDRLQDSFVKQRNLLFDTSHELKTPLTSIRLITDGICGSEADALPEATRESLYQLNGQVSRMERLVKDLLGLSALEATPLIEGKPVHLDELMSGLLMDYQIMADSRDIQLQSEITDHLEVMGDEEKLRRAFSNLLDNAIKYNEEGGRVMVRALSASDEATITVANTGQGVPADAIAKLFDQFYRVEKSRSIHHGGSGLGLTMVKRIIELHGGRVTLESSPKGQTVVTVVLPHHATK